MFRDPATTRTRTNPWLATVILLSSLAHAQSPPDMRTMLRPIAMPDTVWLEDMTVLEIRDAIRAGKTTALVMAGGMEDNGPYVTVSQHNSIMRYLGEHIARDLGNALCAPVVGLAPGTPPGSSSPGSVVVSPETYRAILTDIATSLRAQGFRNIMFLADHGEDQPAAMRVVKALNAKWKGQGATASYVADYYNYDAVQKFSTEILGNREIPEGYHDDYYVAAISVAIDPESVRLPERRKAGKTTINGLDLASPKAVEDGRRIIQFRTDAAVQAIRKLTAGSR